MIRPNILDLEYMLHVRDDLILLDVKEGLKRSKAAIKALLTRDPQHISARKKDTRGNVIGFQGVWLPGDLLAELHDSRLWPVVQVDQNGEIQLCFSRDET